MASEVKRLQKIINPVGFEYRRNTTHAGIYRKSDGKRVLVCSSSASDHYWWKNVIRDLVKYGHVTDEKQVVELRFRSR